VRAAAAAVSAIVAAGVVPRCLEMLDAATLGAVRAAGVAVDLRGPGACCSSRWTATRSESALLERVGEVAAAAPRGASTSSWRRTPAQRDRLWAARRMLSKATRKLARHKLSEDIVVPRTRIADLLARTDDIGRRDRCATSPTGTRATATCT
jgi:glycolate oxidase